MDLNKELEIKIEIVKKSIKEAGGNITQEEMAERLGKSRTYLSRLKKGQENVSPQFLAFFNETFKQFLPNEHEVTKADIAVLQSSVAVMIAEIAKLKKDVYKTKNAKEFLEELKQEIELSEVGMKMQREG